MDIVKKVSSLLLEDETFASELEKWCADHCSVFQGDDDHKLRYTEIHREFCLLFERRIEGFLRDEGYSTVEFWQRLTKAIDDTPLDEDATDERLVMETLRAATDYTQFALTMRSMNS